MTTIAYECAAYRKQFPIWQLLSDVYVGDRAWIEYRSDGTLHPTAKSRRYLPQLPGETSEDYRDRLVSSHFSDKFSQAIRDFVGLVFNNGVRLVGVPDQILEHWSSLDGAGMPGDRLCSLLGIRSLMYGHGFALVDFPAEDMAVVSLADSLGAKRSPYWHGYEPQQVINWRYRRVSGRQVLDMAIIRYQETLPDGPYGEQQQTFYLQLTPGRFDTFILEKGRDSQVKQYHIPERSGVMGLRRRGVVQPFDYIPLVCCYGGDRVGFYQSNPTLLSLAKLNLVHYQVGSDHRQKMHYCCFPTPVRVGGQGEDVILGPRKLMDVPLGGSFGWVEPNSQSLVLSRQELRDLESEMDFLGADYLAKPSDRQAAMTTQVAAKKIESELFLFAQDFAAGLSECLRFHALWLGLPSGGHVSLDTKFFSDLVTDPQLLLAYLRMRELGDITTGELRELATKANYIPDKMTLGESYVSDQTTDGSTEATTGGLPSPGYRF
jgi:hypothetical protein